MRPDRTSGTARLIAAATVLGRHDRRLREILPPEAGAWCERMLGASPEGRRLLAGVRSRAGRLAWRLVERLTAPGIIRHWLLRKRRIEQLARGAAAEGYSQLVVLGAGLDTLALRLAGEGVFRRVIALDHPASQEEVRRTIGAESSGVRLVPADLGLNDLGGALVGDLDPRAPTLLIAEGLLMYLSQEQVCALLRSAAALPCPIVRIIGTYMDTPPGGPIGFRSGSRIVNAWLRRRGEPMRWSITDDALPAFLAQTGWTHRAAIHAAELSREHDPAARPFEGENMFVAQRG